MFEVKFSTDNASFDDYALRNEIADKLTEIADYIRNNRIDWNDGAIRDWIGIRGIGIRVGSYKYVDTSK